MKNNNYPKHLYRYRSLSGEYLIHTLDIIQNNRLYTPFANKLNDPCEGFYKWMDEDFPEFNKGEELRNPRILSFSDKYNITALWAHYSDGFRGVCLEFDFESLRNRYELIEEFEKVIYTKSVPKINLTNKKYMDRFIFKSSDWRHEREWRMITTEANEFLYFNPEILTRIFIGPRIDKNVEKMLLAVIKDRKSIPKIERVRFSKVSYNMIFKTS